MHWRVETQNRKGKWKRGKVAHMMEAGRTLCQTENVKRPGLMKLVLVEQDSLPLCANCEALALKQVDPHLGCPAYPNCDEHSLGCGLVTADPEPVGHRDLLYVRNTELGVMVVGCEWIVKDGDQELGRFPSSERAWAFVDRHDMQAIRDAEVRRRVQVGVNNQTHL